MFQMAKMSWCDIIDITDKQDWGHEINSILSTVLGDEDDQDYNEAVKYLILWHWPTLLKPDLINIS